MFKIFWVWDDKDFVELDSDITEKINEENIWQIAIDILETPYEFIIIAPIAWVDLEDINLSFNNTVLTISWIREKPEIYIESNIIRNSECFWWKFIRNIILPDNLDFDSIKATMENNMLVINIAKLKFSTQDIKINKVYS